ncbi:MAG: alpha/beta hydrolase [Proteobacteria bacterium]|nr:alpha/beta hydrolase [Pseudomonadota bacterium]
MSALPTELSIDSRSGLIAGLRWGVGNKKKILALHGWLDNAASFWQLAPLFAEQGFEVTAIDFPGHGHSAHRAQGHIYAFIDYVIDLQTVMKQLDSRQVTLLCHSMGAAIGQMYTAAYPEKIKRLIMIENLGPVPAYQVGTAAKLLRESLDLWDLHSTEYRNHFNSIDDALKARIKATPMEAEIIRPMVTRGLKKTHKGHHWRTDKRLRLKSLFRLSEEQIQDFLSSNSVPAHLILAKPKTYAMSYPSANDRIKALKPKNHDILTGDHHLHMTHHQCVFNTIIPYM